MGDGERPVFHLRSSLFHFPRSDQKRVALRLPPHSETSRARIYFIPRSPSVSFSPEAKPTFASVLPRTILFNVFDRCGCDTKWRSVRSWTAGL